MEASAKLFTTLLRWDDPVVRDHQVHQVRLLPGISFLDLIYRAGQACGLPLEKLEVRNVLFVAPIALGPQAEKKISISLGPSGDHWKISIKSQSWAEGRPRESDWSENATADAHVASEIPALPLDFDGLKAQTLRRSSLEPLYERLRGAGIVHGPFMKCRGRVLVGEKFLLAKLQLSSAAAAYGEFFHLPLPLLDTATGLSSFLEYAADRFSEKPSVPFFINRFRAIKPLSQACWVYIPEPNAPARRDPDLSEDSAIRFYTREGELLAYFDQLVFKKIRSPSAIASLIADSAEIRLEPTRAVSLSPADSLGEREKKPGLQSRNSGVASMLQGMIAKVLRAPASTISLTTGFYDLGLQSADLLHLVRQLEERCGRQLYPTLMFEHPSVAQLAEHLAENFPEFTGHNGLAPADLDGAATRSKADNRTNGALPSTSPETIEKPTRPSSRAASDSGSSLRERPIAIIGLNGRYPKARTLDEFWDNLNNGRSSIERIPATRWDHSQWFDSDRKNKEKCYTEWGAFLEDYDQFDPLFFNLSPREAELMDPQERLFLETVWATLEDAGYTRERLKQSARKIGRGRVGVFVGLMWGGYQLYGAEEQAKGNMIAPRSGYWSVANRVSYFFDFEGPSMAVDSACSSSLTAIHLACQSILAGDCEMALAGGVNLTLHPSKYLLLCQMNLVASDGRCRSFGAGGDGYVPGEGVGAILLKPLEAAVADRDQIYGVIRGSSINHGGRCNGYSIPNPAAQAAVIQEAYDRAGMTPETIGYLEAQGTGSALGDPIEMAALAKVFRPFAGAEKFCPIGSLKPNIGHAEAASGIAALTKVLLQLKHRRLVPTIKPDELNPNIDFDHSPFFLLTEGRDWKRLSRSGSGEIPRRAGVSCFGVGGSNAHLVLEEFAGATEPSAASETGELIVLSARTPDRLRDQAKNLREFLARVDGREHSSTALSNLAWTLQAGREPMDARLAFAARSLKEAEQRLDQFLSSAGANDEIFQATVRNKTSVLDPRAEPADRDYVHQLIQSGKWKKLAMLWVNGVEIDWAICRKAAISPMSLPTYAFARDRYWIPGRDASQGAAPKREAFAFEETRRDDNGVIFKSELGKEDFHAGDHLVSGAAVLPAAATLEIAAAAGLRIEGSVHRFRNVVWAEPIRFSGERQEIELACSDQNGEASYEIRSIQGEARIVHSRGKFSAIRSHAANGHAELFDWKAALKRCTNRQTHDEVYSLFSERGLCYGPAFQTIRELCSNGQESMARLVLPAKWTRRSHLLEPALLDGAFQTVIGLAQKHEQTSGLFLPFAIREMEIVRPVEGECWAYARPSRGSEAVREFEILLVDDGGNILLRVHRLTMRQVKDPSKLAPEPKSSLFYYRPAWRPVIEATPPKLEPDSFSKTLLVFGAQNADAKAAADWLRETGAKTRTLLVKPGPEFAVESDQVVQVNPAAPSDFTRLFELLEQQKIVPSEILFLWNLSSEPGAEKLSGAELTRWLDRSIGTLLDLFKGMLSHGGRERVRLVYLFQAGHSHLHSLNAALSSFSRTVRLENPKWQIASVQIEEGQPRQKQIELGLRSLFASETGHPFEIQYRNGVRHERVFEPVQPRGLDEMADRPFRRGGVYLITGGAGGLGRILTSFLSARFQAKLVLVGRTPLKPELRAQLDAFEKAGSEIIYERADLANFIETERVIRAALEKFGTLHGIFHCAGVIEDAFITGKSRESVSRVLTPKVLGAVQLDAASQKLALDFFVLFSSVAAVLGNIGQADYAAANGFLDSFSRERERLRKAGERQGKTVSINWPWWREGGMQLPAETVDVFKRRFGLMPLETGAGLVALVHALELDEPQLFIAAGDKQKLDEILEVRPSGEPVASVAEATPRSNGRKQLPADKLREELAALLCRLLKVKRQDLDLDTELGDFGVDSVRLIEFIDEIEKLYGIVLEPANATEFPTINKLADFLAIHTSGRHNGHGPLISAVNEISVRRPEKSRNNGHIDHPRQTETSILSASQWPCPIAVIGMAGRFPEAPSCERFWEHLRQGKHAVREVPIARWDVGRHFSTDRARPNSTYSKWGSFLDGIDLFDPGFFGIRETEAAGIDPQQRIILELAQELFDRSGYSKEELAGTRTAVMLGIGQSDYIPNRLEFLPQIDQQHLIINQLANMAAARVCDFFNLRGPAAALDTACSASLVAIHQACRSLFSGEADLAVAGGIQLLIDPCFFIGFSRAGVLSPTGLCQVFDRKADGMVLGEGAGLVLLKLLPKAIADGDRIEAVILGSAMNNDGHTMGITTPSFEAQKEVLAAAIRCAGIDAETISYLEAHGTGTLLGDPIEIKAATQAFREHTAARQFCGVGSVKSNIGHLLRAAGVASLIKVVSALKHRTIPATLHCREPHPRFRFEDSPFYPVTQLQDWAPRSGVRRAGVSSFGFGGTNCHLIVEEFAAERAAVVRRPRPPSIFQRKRYWIENPLKQPEPINGAHVEPPSVVDPILNTLRRLRGGEIGVAEAKAALSP